jgi:hypothetical protein
VIFGPYDEPPTDHIGGDEVVLGLPPLAHALPTAWDRYLRNRLRHPYEKWLEAALADPPADLPTVTAFWERHHYDALVERWRSAFGDRLLVVVADPGDEPVLTAPSAEVLRRVNVAFHHREWPVARYDRVVRRGVLTALLRRADPAAAGPATPDWAIDKANAIAAADVAKILTSGVRIDGDLAALSRVRGSRGEPADDPHLSIDAAVDAVIAAVDGVAATWPQ